MVKRQSRTVCKLRKWLLYKRPKAIPYKDALFLTLPLQLCSWFGDAVALSRSSNRIHQSRCSRSYSTIAMHIPHTLNPEIAPSLNDAPTFSKINMANPFHLTRLAIVVFKSSNLYVHQISHSLHIPNNNETHWNPSITRSLPVYSDLISLPKPKLSRRFPISMNRPQWLWFLLALSNDRLSACISQIIDRGSFLTGVYPPHHDRYPLIDRSDFPLYQGSG